MCSKNTKEAIVPGLQRMMGQMSGYKVTEVGGNLNTQSHSLL